MSKSNSPTKRATRTGSSASAVSLNDIKSLIADKMNDLTNLIDHTRHEIIQTFRKEIDELNVTISGIKVDVCELQKANEVLKKKCQFIENELAVMKQQQTNALFEITHEVEERELRKLNLVISGLPESSALSDNFEQDDEELCQTMLQKLNILETDGIRIHRIGKIGQTKRPRLLKVKCKNIEQKITILRKGRELRDHQQYKNVYINPDRTYLQRAMHQSLREELKQRRDKGEDVIIFRDRVVQRRNESKRHF